jgi:hypothetical protein
MFKWIKKIFTPKKQDYNSVDVKYSPEKKIDYSKLTKGDLKRLKAGGKIKSIYKPYI